MAEQARQIRVRHRGNALGFWFFRISLRCFGLKGAYGFAVDQFPTARFETTKVERLADGSYAADAKLTIRGITRPVRLPFKLVFDGNRVHLTGKAVLDRTSFGVGQGEWAAPTPVAHAVTVTVDITATRS